MAILALVGFKNMRTGELFDNPILKIFYMQSESSTGWWDWGVIALCLQVELYGDLHI